MTTNYARTALAVLTFLAALTILAALMFAATAGGAWLISEGLMALFPTDYGEISHNTELVVQ